MCSNMMILMKVIYRIHIFVLFNLFLPILATMRTRHRLQQSRPFADAHLAHQQFGTPLRGSTLVVPEFHGWRLVTEEVFLNMMRALGWQVKSSGTDLAVRLTVMRIHPSSAPLSCNQFLFIHYSVTIGPQCNPEVCNGPPPTPTLKPSHSVVRGSLLADHANDVFCDSPFVLPDLSLGTASNTKKLLFLCRLYNWNLEFTCHRFRWP